MRFAARPRDARARYDFQSALRANALAFTAIGIRNAANSDTTVVNEPGLAAKSLTKAPPTFRRAGISTAVIENQTAYVAGWLKKLRDDCKLLIQVAEQAQRAADFILTRVARLE